MARYRIYPSKDNTILENSEINTGLNEVPELWYGGSGVTRYFIKFDFETYNFNYNLGIVPHITAATPTFHLYNCYPTLEVSGDSTTNVATGVDVSVKMVQQNWTEGLGHDFYGQNTIDGKSDWYSATTSQPWAAQGGDFVYEVFSGYVEHGYDNISGSVLNELKLWDAFTGINNGLVVKFSDAVEALTGESKTILKFFGNDTHTYYRPYIQFDWDSQITDQRDEVMSGTTKRIYLYLKKDGEFTNANSISGVSISFSDDSVTHTGFTESSIYNPMPGFYYVDFDCPIEATASTVFTDVWDVQYESGMAYQTLSQTGVVQQLSSSWSVSQDNVISLTDYKILTPAIKHKYEKGTRIYLEVNNYTPRTSIKNILKSMEYKLELKDGKNRYTMIDWEGVSYTQTDNFIMIDTDWLFDDNLYVLSFRYSEDGSLIYNGDEKEFRIV